MPEEIKKQKRPALIGIIALLMLLGGILEVILAIPSVMLFGIAGIIQIIIGLAGIAVAIGLDKMKLWALYILVVITLVSVVFAIITQSFIFETIVSVLITAYIWNSKKLFS